MRAYCGEDPSAPIRHSEILSGIDMRVMELKTVSARGAVAATLIPSVGCPMGCNFCTTSAFFGGKGKFLDFYTSGREPFDVVEGLESSMKVQSFFVREERRLARGRTYEPRTITERSNWIPT